MTASYRHMRPKSRRPCSMATGSRPLAWGRMTERLLRASRRPTRASGPGRACGPELGLVIDNLS
jgi:hypothetical protein